MSDIIQLLPDSVANQIAAGEVIQRPASVVKELVENAVDAGAKNIQVLILDAGRTSIQVVDDGKGMSDTDARLAFERHATSKIRKADDLFSLHTMGFRGEALPSIAAVAQVELKTRQDNEEVGTFLSVIASRFTGQEPCSCPVGSNFKIENLFYNVPARRKFLKSNTTELNNILTAFERIVLVNPSIHFTLYSNGVELMNLYPGNIRQRILDVFGKRLNQDLLPVNVETSLCKISGFVGKPESARKKGAHQYFFVNERYMKHPYFNKAVLAAYDRLIPMGEQIPYFIYFNVDPHNIDVNIHPTKTEIKFENEQPIWQILQAAVKESVGLFNNVPSIDFDTEGKPDIPVFDTAVDNGEMPKMKYNPSYNPFNTVDEQDDASNQTVSSAFAPSSMGDPSHDRKLSLESSGQARMSKVGTDWQQLYGIEHPAAQEGVIFESKQNRNIVESSQHLVEDKSPLHYQYKGKYIMTAVKSGLMIIDQHRAHVRILYEQYLQQMENHMFHPQKVLFPETVHFTPSEIVVLKKILPKMTEAGFDLTDLGKGSYAVNSVPSGLENVNEISLVEDMVQDAIAMDRPLKEEISQSLALSMATQAAIPQGQVLGNDEMESIVNGLFSCSNPNYAPDGKNILCILTQEEINHLLG
ncbi:MAG TPA: DNA mismatch repair endonuclease MutL [Prevotella sp.]|nr:DNA mismatch repair endonuclease MutL [Prevotella sp.]